MYIKERLIEESLKQCPFCEQTVILVSTVGYPAGEDDGYKIACKCGWASRVIHGWESNKGRLIERWNDLIHDDVEVEEQADVV